MTPDASLSEGEPHLPVRLVGRGRERLRHGFGLFSGYWLSRDWPFAWTALVALIVIDMGGVYAGLLANRWQQSFYDSIQNRAAALFATLVLTFLGIMALQVGQTMVRTAIGMALNLRWRAHLTARYLDRWFDRDSYAEVERLHLIDNPDQRIADDILRLTGTGVGVSFLECLLALVSSAVGAITFSIVLLQTAQPIRFALFGRAVAIPGDTVWYGWAYAIAGMAFIVWIGRPYVRGNMRQQRCEGDFRGGLLQMRRNAAQIAFAGAGGAERRGLDAAFDAVRANYRRLIVATLGINLGQGIYERIGSAIPLFVTVPRYFRGQISFGAVMGGQDAFGRLTGSLSYFVQAYGTIGGHIANINRLKTLDDALSLRRPRGIAYEAMPMDAGVALTLDAVRVDRIDGAQLLRLPHWTVRRGERWVVRGTSGAGKSTLLRALAGLWPDGEGSIRLNGNLRTMFVPQRLYLPLGTLRAALTFPASPDAVDDARVRALLREAELGVHEPKLDERRHWQDELSPGEQQRVALVRILLHRPDILVLDEATSALDADHADAFFAMLAAQLPGLTTICVVHDDRLERFHSHRLRIADGHAAAVPTDHEGK